MTNPGRATERSREGPKPIAISSPYSKTPTACYSPEECAAVTYTSQTRTPATSSKVALSERVLRFLKLGPASRIFLLFHDLTTLSSSAPSLPSGTRKCTLVERSNSIRSIGFEKDLERNGWRIQVFRSTLHISIDPTHEKALPCPAKPEGL